MCYGHFTMSEPLQVRIARAGKEVGTYDSAEALRLLGEGTLKPTDNYWHIGMGGWELLSKLDASEGLRLTMAEVRAKGAQSKGAEGINLWPFRRVLLTGGIALFLHAIRNHYDWPILLFAGAIALRGLRLIIAGPSRKMSEPPQTSKEPFVYEGGRLAQRSNHGPLGLVLFVMGVFSVLYAFSTSDEGGFLIVGVALTFMGLALIIAWLVEKVRNK